MMEGVYFRLGASAKRQGLPRSANPYNFTTDKGHYWDMGWMSEANKTVHKVRNTV